MAPRLTGQRLKGADQGTGKTRYIRIGCCSSVNREGLGADREVMGELSLIQSFGNYSEIGATRQQQDAG